MTANKPCAFLFFAGMLAAFLTSAQASAQPLSEAEAAAVATSVIALVDSHYVFPEKTPAITEAVQSQLKNGRYRTAAAHEAAALDSLAAWLTADLRAASGDKHLYVEYLEGEPENVDWDAWAVEERREETLKNFGFAEARVLGGNVGYLRITEFMHPDRGYEAARAAMALLARTEAMVIDVRGNPGGYGGLMELILSYFFSAAPTHLSTTYVSEGEPTKTFTLPFVPGRRREGTPLYVLVDEGTGSAAEYFAYTLQTFDKAEIVGQPTAGAAHRNTYYEVSSYNGPGRFRVSVSTGAPINPVTEANWEGQGVQPDTRASAEEALEAAHRQALRALLRDAESAPRRAQLENALQEAGPEKSVP